MMVPMGRFELPTSPLPRECSTPELHGRIMFGAGEGNRTLTVSLEGFCSTIELHPLFHLIAPSVIGGGRRIRTFEAHATDLQSAPFDRSGIPPKESDILLLVLFLVKNFFRNLNSALLNAGCFVYDSYLKEIIFSYFAISSSCVSGCSSSIKMQSTGHTCWHCGSS